MKMMRAGLVGAAVSLARSEQGQRAIRLAREKYDTPANRAKLREAVAHRRGRQGPSNI